MIMNHITGGKQEPHKSQKTYKNKDFRVILVAVKYQERASKYYTTTKIDMSERTKQGEILKQRDEILKTSETKRTQTY